MLIESEELKEFIQIRLDIFLKKDDIISFYKKITYENILEQIKQLEDNNVNSRDNIK